MKKKVFFRIGILIPILLSVSTAYAGGGWTQKKHEGFFKLSQYTIRANKLFNASTNLVDIKTTSVYATSIYAEYGFSKRFTGIAYIPFFVRTTINKFERRDGTVEPGDELSSFGDPNLSIKYGIISGKKTVLSASFTLGIPLGKPSGGRTLLLQTGDGELNRMLTIEASHSFHPTNLYITLMTGFNDRTENFSDEFRFGFEAGYGVGKFWFLGRINGVKSFMNGDGPSDVAQGIFGNNVEYVSISPEIIYNISDKIGVSLGAAGAVSGRQILASPAFDVGVFFNLKE